MLILTSVHTLHCSHFVLSTSGSIWHHLVFVMNAQLSH